MKNKKVYISLALSLTTFFFGGCDKYFEVNPDMRTELNTIEKVGQLLVTAYPNTDYLLFAELASDNSTDKGPGQFSIDNVAKGSYFWSEVSQGQDRYSPSTYWLDVYRAIAAANQAIEVIEENNFGVKGEQYKGEALICRAYAHHMLVSLFSKMYQVNGDNSSYGIPYPTTPEKNAFQNYDRGTVASVYEQIEKDLLAGMKLIQGATFKSSKFHFNEQAVNAFAARFYLFKGEYDKVIQYSSAIFPENNFKQNIRPIAGVMKAAGGGVTTLFTSSQQNFNLLLANVFSDFYNLAANGRYGLGQDIEKIISGINVTGKPFYQFYTRVGGVADKLAVGKYPRITYRPSQFSSAVEAYTTQCLFSADEALINRAEAYVQTGKYDLALKDLNDFAAVRIDGYDVALNTITEQKAKEFYKTNDIKEALINTVLDFKQKAFVHEGLRWFDINRHEIEITHKFQDDMKAESFDTLKKEDPRRIFQVPESAYLSGVPKNPR